MHDRLEEDERDPRVTGRELAQRSEGTGVVWRVRTGVPPIEVAAAEGDDNAREEECEVTDEVFVIFRPHTVPGMGTTLTGMMMVGWSRMVKDGQGETAINSSNSAYPTQGQ